MKKLYSVSIAAALLAMAVAAPVTAAAESQPVATPTPIETGVQTDVTTATLAARTTTTTAPNYVYATIGSKYLTVKDKSGKTLDASYNNSLLITTNDVTDVIVAGSCTVLTDANGFFSGFSVTAPAGSTVTIKGTCSQPSSISAELEAKGYKGGGLADGGGTFSVTVKVNADGTVSGNAATPTDTGKSTTTTKESAKSTTTAAKKETTAAPAKTTAKPVEAPKTGDPMQPLTVVLGALFTCALIGGTLVACQKK